jgi:hypothetical protein
MLDLPLVRPPQLYNSLVIGKIIYSPESITPSGTDWGNDGYDEELVAHVVAYEQKWGEDGYDDALNQHMDIYEGLIPK